MLEVVVVDGIVAREAVRVRRLPLGRVRFQQPDPLLRELEVALPRCPKVIISTEVGVYSGSDAKRSCLFRIRIRIRIRGVSKLFLAEL